MNKCFWLALVLCIGLGMAPSLGSAAKQSATGGGSAADEEQVKQVERDWTDAMKAADVKKMTVFIADDWVGVGPDGEKMTKEQYLDGYKQGTSKAESVDMGPMNVVILGKVAVVQGSDTEKSTQGGKDTSGKYVWMDVFEKKDGKWQAVRSSITKVG